jgi:putative transcriptional regulator
MAIKYYKLLILLNKRDISKNKLKEDLGLGSNTIAKFANHDPVSFEVLDKLCKYLNVQPGDLLEYEDSDE